MITESGGGVDLTSPLIYDGLVLPGNIDAAGN